VPLLFPTSNQFLHESLSTVGFLVSKAARFNV
jgi:hypothetical protein